MATIVPDAAGFRAAADAGVSPVIIEKMDRVGGNSALSTGSVR